MISIEQINQHFDPEKLVGTGISGSEWAILCADERIFTTRVRLYEWQAEKIIGESPDGYPQYSYLATYSGFVITNNKADWGEARSIALKRGWGEEVDGILVDTISWEAAGNLVPNNMN